jgi:hypothetical protein
MGGMPAGETARIRDDGDKVVYSYRSFTSVVGIVASLVAAIVTIAGFAATVFLILEKHPIAAIIAIVLSVFFALIIVMLVPPLTVTLFNEETPAVTISQRSRTSFPSVTYAIVTPDGRSLALFRKSLFSRLGRNKWTIFDSTSRFVGTAAEESLSRALIRKVIGKFNRKFESNVHVRAAGIEAARIVRRDGADLLEIRSDVIDRRVLIALATLILGAEP